MKYRIWSEVNKNYEDNTTYVCKDGKIKTLWVEDCVYIELEQSDYTVELSTGLKDKNGVEIYEGDIVKQIFYGEIQEGDVKIVSTHGFMVSNGRWGIWSYDIEKIGNIHDKSLTKQSK